MDRKVAIPVLNESVAPCFEVARYFMISEIQEGKKSSTTTERCTGCEGYGRVRFLCNNKINTLICNGIKMFYRDLLEMSGLEVISNIADSADKALSDYLAGQLKPEKPLSEIPSISAGIPHEDIVCWARELFESHGYVVSSPSDPLYHLIDLIAELNCPMCGKLIKVAICCGAHTYRPDYEIKEFHHLAPAEYQAKVYIYPATSEIRRTCLEYDIELIDLSQEDYYSEGHTTDKIPILQKPIPGHEIACLASGKTRSKW